ncbi:hypothetical protein HZA43_03930 [Candidatus Peregrinibacteria bacterium]|nr:hypothetical protein [Candidatus Peregrinibacteria bacterium]
MGEGDMIPRGGQHAKIIDPKRIQKIKEGGKKADEIRKKADQLHRQTEELVADQQLMNDLNKI